MKKILLFSNVLFFLLALSFSASGIYTGTNPNVAAFKTVLASDSVSVPAGNEPGKAVDTLLTTYCKIPGTDPAWIQIDLGGYYYVDGYAIVLPYSDQLPTDYIFQVSEDGATWTDVDNQNISTLGTYSFDVVSPDPVMFVRIYMNTRHDPASFTEILVYGEELLTP